MRARTAILLAGCVLGSCKTGNVPSEWPPDDFYLHVSHTVVEQGKVREQRRFEVWRDGLAVLREAPNGLLVPGADGVWFPAFSKVAAYQLRPPSTRQLARLLERAGLFERDLWQSHGRPAGVPDEQVAIRFHGLGHQRTVYVHGSGPGRVTRVLHVINAFLPAGHAFELRDMTGEPEEPHLLRVPEPVDSVPGALAFHEQELLARAPSDDQVLVDVFVLAVLGGRRDLAERMLHRLEALERERAQTERLFPAGEPAGLVEQLGRLLPPRGDTPTPARRP